jgi:insertion element IS1 protein InsB
MSLDAGRMITTTIQHHCRKCGSTSIVKNGHNRSGRQQYRCKDCRAIGVLMPKPPRYSDARREEVLRAYQERPSMRGISRIFGVARTTLAAWIKKKLETLPSLKQTLPKAETDDVLDVDEAWSFVRKRLNKRWLWTVLLRRTRHILAFLIGAHSARTCRRVWHRIPAAFRRCASYSDFWEAYQTAFPTETPRCVGKETGETAHQERWDNTLRQRLARYVRKTLSFSKRDRWHDRVTTWFILTYNINVSCNG